jgi:Fe-S oxidoreductase
VRQANQDSLHCNGNAACFNYDPDDAMCPSWKATRDRKHSPKGRASLMREWLLLLADSKVDPGRRRPARQRWSEFPARALNTWRARRGHADFSLQVKEAMDGCLACKSCVGQCPIKVDVPSFRSRFLEAYHGRYLRPAKDLLVAASRLAACRSPGAAPVQCPPQSRAGRGVARALGLVALPELSDHPAAGDARRPGVQVATAAALRALSPDDRRRSVVVVQDAFTSYYDAQVVLDFCELLQRLGFTPWLAPLRPNGKPQQVLGFLPRSSARLPRNAGLLRELADRRGAWWVSTRR